MCVSIFIGFHAIIFRMLQSEPTKPARKQNLTRSGHSRSFKVTHFGITEKLTTDCLSLYYSAGLTSKVSEEIASANAENCCCRQLHCRLMPLSREHPRIPAYTLYCQNLSYIRVRSTNWQNAEWADKWQLPIGFKNALYYILDLQLLSKNPFSYE